MKTFEELKKTRLTNEKIKLVDAEKKYDDSHNNTWYQNYAYYKQMENSKKVIENIDESVKMEIALYTNILYDSLSEASNYCIFSENFNNLFQKYINDAETIFKDGNIYSFRIDLDALYPLEIIQAIVYFGFTKDDLQMLSKKQNGIITKDIFIQFINDCYGTNIPLKSEWVEFFAKPMPQTIFEMKQYNCNHNLLLLRNGKLMDGNYPLQYEDDILKKFNITQEQRGNTLIKRLSQSK